MKKTTEITLTVATWLIFLGYVASVIRTDILVPEWEKGLPLVMGFVLLPFLGVFTIFLCSYCIKSLTGIGKYLNESNRHCGYVLSKTEGVIRFVLLLGPSLFFLAGTVVMFLAVTGIYSFGLLTI